MLYLVRHGQTDYNIDDRIQGRTDVPLNKVGLEESKKVAELLKYEKIDYIFSSPLKRTKTTAEEINIYHKKKIIFDDRIIAFNSGSIEGTAPSDEFLDEFYRHTAHEYGAEDIHDIYIRVLDFVNDIYPYYDKNIVVVTHGNIISMFNFILNNKDIDKDFYERRGYKNTFVLKIELKNYNYNK